ncbi:uncharacterized protein RMCC_2703 [Mycolicibacterium canariasense]|uniref:Uncharacterized protein n=2 Tax=Mycolicibacterium TaxID=1866885 RepID=A0A100WC13_MYCCR|nr:hypothetical protein MMAGJ_68140 [Mycolicibacterium mageritense]GAS95737.1 uncharacterized protein RMCC_2703 [Mycolicibacterium canariasense]
MINPINASCSRVETMPEVLFVVPMAAQCGRRCRCGPSAARQRPRSGTVTSPSFGIQPRHRFRVVRAARSPGGRSPVVGLYTAGDARLRIRKRHRGTAVSCLYALYGGTDSDFEDYFEALI